MRFVKCPTCSLPLSRDESLSGTCPSCGVSFAAGAASRPVTTPAPLPSDEATAAALPRRVGTGLVVAGFAVAVLVVGGLFLHCLTSLGLLSLGGESDEVAGTSGQVPAWLRPGDQTTPKDAPEGETPDQPVTAPAPAENTPATPDEAEPAPPADEPPATAQARADTPATPPDAPQTSPREPLPPEAAPAEEPPPEKPFSVVFDHTTEVDRPDGEYVIEAVDGAIEVKLSGRVRTLKVGPVNGGSVLDASGLEAKEVLFTGAIDGHSVVRLCAPNGKVEFRAPVNGQSKVVIDAPNGRVTFAGPGGSPAGSAEINGESQIDIVARDVDFAGAINGTHTLAAVTLTRGGTLRFAELNGHSRIHYRKADPADPALRIECGSIRAAAEVKQVD